MATIKSYTDLQQSCKLAEILPLESADMRYGYIAPYDYSDRMYDGGYDEIPYPKDFLIKNPNFSANEYDAELPCWSLTALLGVLPDNYIDVDDAIKRPSLMRTKDSRYMVIYSAFQYTSFYDNPIDACVAMIEKLHKLNLL